MDVEDGYLRPERLAEVADYLDEALKKFRSWGISIGPHCRLLTMSRLLKVTAGQGAFPAVETELSVLAEAIRNAQEFVEIASVLPETPIPSVQHDLRIAVQGKLEPVGRSTGAHLQFQTQLWVGAMLAQAGAQVGVLKEPSNEANPDFILNNGTMRYAVEVKRPNGQLDAHNIVRKAARQIRHERFHGGMIVVDLTDCIDPSIRHQCGRGPAHSNEVHHEVSRLLELLNEQVFDDHSERLRSRREHVFGMIGYARAAYWDLDALEHPNLSRQFGTLLYWRQDHRTLRAHRARWLTDLIHRGLDAAGHEGHDYGEIQWSRPHPKFRTR